MTGKLVKNVWKIVGSDVKYIICNWWSKTCKKDGPVRSSLRLRFSLCLFNLTLFACRLWQCLYSVFGECIISDTVRAWLHVCDDECLCLADRARGPCSRWRKGGAEDGWELGGVEFGLCFPYTDQEGHRGCGDETCCQGSPTAKRYRLHLATESFQANDTHKYHKYMEFIYSNHHCSPLILLDSCFNLFLNQLTCANNLRCLLWRCSLNLSQSPRGSSCASSVCRYTLTFHLWALEGTDYAFSLSSCYKSSAQCWLIHLCMCNVFCKAQCLGDTHCYALVRLHRAPRALHNQNTVCACALAVQKKSNKHETALSQCAEHPHKQKCCGLFCTSYMK